MKNLTDFLMRIYKNSRTFLMIVLYVLIAKGLISAGSTYAEDVSTPVKSEVMTEPVPVAVAVELTEETPPGKTKEQIEEEYGTLIQALVTHEVIKYAGDTEFAPARNRIRRAVISYARELAPAILQGDIQQNFQSFYYPGFLDVMLNNRLVIDEFYAQALVVGEMLKHIDPNNAYEEFTVPDFEIVQKTVRAMYDNGYDQEEAISFMRKYQMAIRNK